MLGLTIGLGVFITSAFTPPTTAPGTVAPSLLNSEPENQIKSGGLGVGSFLVSDYAADFLTKLTVGTQGNSSDILNIGYDASGSKVGGSEIATTMTLPNLGSSNVKLCVDNTGTLTLCDISVTLTANPISVVSGSASALTWSSKHATSCAVTTISGYSKTGISGTNVSTGNLTSDTTFTAKCTGPAGTALATATVTIAGVCGPASGNTSNPTTGLRSQDINNGSPENVACTSGAFSGVLDGNPACLYPTPEYGCPSQYHWKCGSTTNCYTVDAREDGSCGSGGVGSCDNARVPAQTDDHKINLGTYSPTYVGSCLPGKHFHTWTCYGAGPDGIPTIPSCTTYGTECSN